MNRAEGWEPYPRAASPVQGFREGSDEVESRTEQGGPLKWVDEWSVPCLSHDDRKSIDACFLRSHAIFLRSYANCLPAEKPMQLAFDGIAQVLFDAGLLTPELLLGELRLLVLESAVAANWWWPTYGEQRTEVLPGLLGHCSAWQERRGDHPQLFEAETAEWTARMLEGTGAYVGRPELPTDSLDRAITAEWEAAERLEHAVHPDPAATPKYSCQRAELNAASTLVDYLMIFAEQIIDAYAEEYLRIFPERIKSGNLLTGEIGPEVTSSTKLQWTRWKRELGLQELDGAAVTYFSKRLNDTVSKRIIYWQTRPEPVTADPAERSENTVVTPSNQPPEGMRPAEPAECKDTVLKRGRKTAFAPLQLQTAREMKQAGKRNQEIAKVLWGINAPTANQRRSVPTILSYHFPQDRGSSRGRSKQ